MARHKTSTYEAESEPQLDISSLIDVCFLLLIYFIVTSTIVPREQDLGMGLPSDVQTPNKKPPISPMAVRITDEGAVVSGMGSDERVLDTDVGSRDLPLLVSQLKLYTDAAASSSDIPSVQLRVDEKVRQQRVIDVLNAFAAAGISMVAFNDLGV